MLGAVIIVPLILASGPLAGYVLGQFVLVNYFKLPEVTIAISVALGFFASGLQIYRIIQEIRQFDKEKKV